VTGETHFKGWAKPGPVPLGLDIGLTVSRDVRRVPGWI